MIREEDQYYYNTYRVYWQKREFTNNESLSKKLENSK